MRPLHVLVISSNIILQSFSEFIFLFYSDEQISNYKWTDSDLPVGKCAISGDKNHFKVADCEEEHRGLCQMQGIF